MAFEVRVQRSRACGNVFRLWVSLAEVCNLLLNDCLKVGRHERWRKVSFQLSSGKRKKFPGWNVVCRFSRVDDQKCSIIIQKHLMAGCVNGWLWICEWRGHGPAKRTIGVEYSKTLFYFLVCPSWSLYLCDLK